MPREKIRALLAGGTRRALGRSGEVVEMISRQPAQFPSLIALLRDPDPVVRMRAADAAEKVTRNSPLLLQPFKSELLGLLREAVQQELRWHLAQMIPRLQLSARERRKSVECFEAWLNDKSSIVRTLAMQALCDLAMQDQALLPGVTEQIRVLSRTGTPAMKARGKKLLQILNRADP